VSTTREDGDFGPTTFAFALERGIASFCEQDDSQRRLCVDHLVPRRTRVEAREEHVRFGNHLKARWSTARPDATRSSGGEQALQRWCRQPAGGGR
jgi:hypothetical protein